MKNVHGILHETKLPAFNISDMTPGIIYLKVYYWLETKDPSISGFEIKTKTVDLVIKALTENGFDLPGSIETLLPR